MNHLLFVHEDDADILPLMPYAEFRGFEVSTARSLHEALSVIHTTPVDIVIADMTMSDGRGANMLSQKDDFLRSPNTKLFFTHEDDPPLSAEEANLLDSQYFLKKPLTVSQLEYIFDLHQATSDRPLSPHFSKLIGQAPAMKNLYHLVERVAPTSVSVFIIGKSGTGKELVAEAIHERSNRSRQPCISINCATISPELMSSELFGHEKGSFTGADHSHKGYFEQASGGTLFLDEITETSQDFQVKLLRVLETGTIIPVGGKREIQVDVRIIAATNRNPEQAVAEGILREDLYYRLNVFPIQMPELNERENDIILLAHYFLEMHNQREKTAITFTPEALELIKNTNYAGNVRQLKNMIHRAYILSDDVIDVSHLSS